MIQVIVNEEEAETIRENARRLGVSSSLLLMAAVSKATNNLTSFDELPISDFLSPLAGRTRGQRRRAIRVPVDS